MTVRCLHCGPVRIIDPPTVRANQDILDALSQGSAPLAAITCPWCHEEIFARDVTP